VFSKINYSFSPNLLNMPKARAKPNKLFHNKLSENTMAYIKQEFPDWLQDYKQRRGEPTAMSMGLIQDFVEHLMPKSSRFKDVNVFEMKCGQTGTSTLYDFIRKRLGKHQEEKPATPAKIKATPGKHKPRSQGAPRLRKETRANAVQHAQTGEQDAV